MADARRLSVPLRLLRLRLRRRRLGEKERVVDQLQQRHPVRPRGRQEGAVPAVARGQFRDDLGGEDWPSVLEGLHPPEELGVGDDVGRQGVEERVGDVPDVEEAEDVLPLLVHVFFWRREVEVEVEGEVEEEEEERKKKRPRSTNRRCLWKHLPFISSLRGFILPSATSNGQKAPSPARRLRSNRRRGRQRKRGATCSMGATTVVVPGPVAHQKKKRKNKIYSRRPRAPRGSCASPASSAPTPRCPRGSA